MKPSTHNSAHTMHRQDLPGHSHHLHNLYRILWSSCRDAQAIASLRKLGICALTSIQYKWLSP